MKNRIVALFVLAPILTFAPGHAAAQEPSEGVRKVVTRVAAQYPGIARNYNIQGSVRMDVLVAPNGSVKSVEVKGGHPLLAQAAQNALRQWKWEPAPRETHESVEVRFGP
ncbi:MAG: energy transducer TonB [Candidatus Sulfotelmatobacter sp.]